MGGDDERRRWDVHLKRLAGPAMPHLLAAVGAEVPDEVLVPQNVELPVETRRVDLLGASRSGVLVHVEIQRAADHDMAQRMVLYGALLLGRRPFGRPVRRLVQIVLQLSGPPMTVSLDVGGLATRVHLIHVPSTAPEVFLATPTLAPLALSAGDARVVPAVVRSFASLEGGDLQESALTLALQISPRLADNVMQELRRVGMLEYAEVMDELRQTEWGRGLVREARAEGREEGREEGLRAAVSVVLARRFPDARPADLDRTVARLVRDHGPDAVGAALDLAAPDA